MAAFCGRLCGHEFLVLADDQAHATKLTWDDLELSRLADEAKAAGHDGRLYLTQLHESAPGVFRLAVQ